jgi:gamma-D-glutamyl-L-lysine dipeptidyl-peptidase
MDIFVCENVFVPLRSAPSHKSEMLSQILFGEKYVITDSAGHWLKVKTFFDDYSGWIDQNHLLHSGVGDDTHGRVLQRSLLCCRNDGTRLVLEAGCEIYNPDFSARTFYAGENSYSAGDEFSELVLTSSEDIAGSGLRFINSPYIWGGRIPSGIDCSGFTQLVCKLHGFSIPRDSRDQSDAGTQISFLEEAIPGDLVFFDDDRGNISHVGMILSRGLVIHASGRVRIDIIDHQGIYRNDISGYSHRLRTIRRVA